MAITPISWNVVLMDTYRIPFSLRAATRTRARAIAFASAHRCRGASATNPHRPQRLDRFRRLRAARRHYRRGIDCRRGPSSPLTSRLTALVTLHASSDTWTSRNQPWFAISGKDHCLRDLFWYPLAGVTYQFLHYLIGLGSAHDPYTLRLGRWFDPGSTRHFGRRNGTFRRWSQFSRRTALRTAGPSVATPDGQCYGMAEDQILRLTARRTHS